MSGGERRLERTGASFYPPLSRGIDVHVQNFTAPGRCLASAHEKRVECRLIVVGREQGGRNEGSHEAHENEHDEHLDQRKTGAMTHVRKIESGRRDR